MESLYEGLFLRAVVGFEDLLQDVFFAVLSGKSSKKAWTPIVTGRMRDLRRCIFDQKRYLDWLPYRNTVGRANLYLSHGLPFTLLDDRQKTLLNSIVCIRNAIAHPSEFALEKFRRVVVGNTSLPPKERRPSSFLLGYSRPSHRRYEVYARGLGSIASMFC